MSQLLQNAAYGTVMVLAVVLLRRVLGRRLVPEARLALWAVCLFRLLTPAAPESVLSLWGLSRLFVSKQQAAPASYAPGFVPPAAVPAPAPQLGPAPVFTWEDALLVLWLAVGAVLAARYVLSWRRTRRAVACAIPLDRSDPRYAPLPKCARLREGPMEGAPLTFGAVLPTVVLSPGLDGPELECVLAHEGVHAQRRDNLWHYAMALALIVHWWNPAVWLMARLLRMDIELSCDRAVVKKLGANRRADYAEALVSLAATAEGPAFCQTFGRKATEERILSIMKFKKTSLIGAIFTLALVLAVTAAFASEPKQPDEDSYTSIKGPTLAQSVTSKDGSITEYTVDLTFLEQNLAKHVADGSMTQEEADRILGQAKLFLDEDGKAMVWSFQGDSGLTLDELHSVCYRDENGNLIPLDPADVVGSFIFPANGYVLEHSSSAKENSIDLVPLSLAEFQAALAQQVRDGSMTQEEADQRMDSLLALLDLSDVDDIYVPDPLLSIFIQEEDFTVAGYTLSGFFTDDPGQTPSDSYEMRLPTVDENGVSRAYDKDGSLMLVGTPFEPVPSAAPDGSAAQPQVNAAPSTSCGVEGCTETRYHAHNEGRTILLSEPCPVEGCAITGNHIHGDVCYSCNGTGHSGGHCDGSCYTYFTLSDPAPASGHHSEHH